MALTQTNDRRKLFTKRQNINTKIDFNSILEQTSFGLDTLTMLCDVEDFIELSENNIERQKQRELLRAEQECNNAEFNDPNQEAQYRSQMLQGVEFRFDVSLTQRVRYAALVALITTVEWVLLSLKERRNFTFPKTPKKMNETIHVLSVFNEKAALALEQKISSLETLIYIRNCIVHAAGLLLSYKYETELRQRLITMTGIKISNINFLGEGIEIETGFLQESVKDVRLWLPNIERAVLELAFIR